MSRRHWVALAVAATFGLAAVGWVALSFGADAADDERVQALILAAQRAQCEQLNIVRDNQYRGIGDQIRATERSLEEDLGDLERFRKQAVADNRVRRARQRALRTVRFQVHQRRRPRLVDCGRLRETPPKLRGGRR